MHPRHSRIHHSLMWFSEKGGTAPPVTNAPIVENCLIGLVASRWNEILVSNYLIISCLSCQIHSNSHTGQKRVYDCILNMGKIDHTKRLAFACPVQHCGRSFSVLSNMRRHARSHGSDAVAFTKSASDHYPLSLSSAPSDLYLSSSSPTQSHDSHRRYGNSTYGPATHHVKKHCFFNQWRRRENFQCNYHACHWTRCLRDWLYFKFSRMATRNFTRNFHLMQWELLIQGMHAGRRAARFTGILLLVLRTNIWSFYRFESRINQRCRLW
jgi:hypothetical protein